MLGISPHLFKVLPICLLIVTSAFAETSPGDRIAQRVNPSYATAAKLAVESKDPDSTLLLLLAEYPELSEDDVIFIQGLTGDAETALAWAEQQLESSRDYPLSVLDVVAVGFQASFDPSKENHHANLSSLKPATERLAYQNEWLPYDILIHYLRQVCEGTNTPFFDPEKVFTFDPEFARGFYESVSDEYV